MVTDFYPHTKLDLVDCGSSPKQIGVQQQYCYRKSIELRMNNQEGDLPLLVSIDHQNSYPEQLEWRKIMKSLIQGIFEIIVGLISLAITVIGMLFAGASVLIMLVILAGVVLFLVLIFAII
jgi:hypothetical protein